MKKILTLTSVLVFTGMIFWLLKPSNQQSVGQTDSKAKFFNFQKDKSKSLSSTATPSSIKGTRKSSKSKGSKNSYGENQQNEPTSEEKNIRAMASRIIKNVKNSAKTDEQRAAVKEFIQLYNKNKNSKKTFRFKL